MNHRRSFLGKAVAGGVLANVLSVFPSFAKEKEENQVSFGKKVLVHQVYFWLKPDLTKEQVLVFDKGVKSLLKIKTMRYGDVGKAAKTPVREVIDTTYSYSLLTIFDDVAGHDSYQNDPIHLEFLKNCKELWTSVKVYDASSV